MMKELAIKAVHAKKDIQNLSTSIKNQILMAIADELVVSLDQVLFANKIDLDQALEKSYHSAFLERLVLNEKRIHDMAQGLRLVASLEDPIGKILEVNKRPNGLLITKKVVPLGVIGIIYESRPNVTIDTFALCFKSGNVSVLKGGKEAIESNKALVEVIHSILKKYQVNKDVVTLVEDTSRVSTNEMMTLPEYFDLLIPRGGASLIQSIKEHSQVPVIETGSGICHLYVDQDADIDMALDIAYNAKVDRPAVCNSIETILVHTNVSEDFLVKLKKSFKGLVEIHGCEKSSKYLTMSKIATEEDYHSEYDDLIVNLKVVDSFEDAITHINHYSTHHSETIITKNEDTAQAFLDAIDSAVVYHNASTRFSDGFEFGFGAEVGISTQKLHARGPMGVDALTTTKYQVYGNGQVRKTS